LKKKLVFWVERYFYNPTVCDRVLSFLLLPLSVLYCSLMFLRYKTQKLQDLEIPVIGVGNLNVGGSGKTPLVTALAKEFEKPAIVLRGYGRQTKGLVVVKQDNIILCDVDESGDEAMIYAQKLSDTIVIVSEDRVKGILKAKELGAKVVFLDDAYSKHNIKKLDIVIEVESKNRFCLPSGPFRELLYSSKKNLIVVKEGREFSRKVTIRNKTSKMSLVTAIARPQRLDRFLPKEVIARHYFEDHHSFTKKELEEILAKDKSESLFVTYKDYVKIEKFGFKVSSLELDLELNECFLKKVRGKYRL